MQNTGSWKPYRVAFGYFLHPKLRPFTAIVQVAAKANVDESLQVPKRVACIAATIVVRPSPHRNKGAAHRVLAFNVGNRFNSQRSATLLNVVTGASSM
jgi:hypothetical protein